MVDEFKKEDRFLGILGESIKMFTATNTETAIEYKIGATWMIQYIQYQIE